jgi:6-phosphogluconolactonase
MDQGTSLLLIGTYTESLPHVQGRAVGISTAVVSTGVPGDVRLAAFIRNPSWIALSASGANVYAVIEGGEFNGWAGGAVASFRVTRDPHGLVLLNVVPSGGEEPAHVTVDPTGRFLLVANYGSGTIAVFTLSSDGQIGDRVEHIEHSGSPTGTPRQDGSHVHQIVFDPLTGDVLVTDLGLDRVFSYAMDSRGRLRERSSGPLIVRSGAGPRHLTFHPSGRHLFLVNELDNTVVVFERSGDSFVVRETRSTLPGDFRGHNQAAAIRISASGRWVFASNRGHDSIVMFPFDESTGSLGPAHFTAAGGASPRDFILTADDRFLLVANQDSQSIATLEVDEPTQSLTIVASVATPTPVCLAWVPVPIDSPGTRG